MNIVDGRIRGGEGFTTEDTEGAEGRNREVCGALISFIGNCGKGMVSAMSTVAGRIRGGDGLTTEVTEDAEGRNREARRGVLPLGVRKSHNYPFLPFPLISYSLFR